MGRAANWTPQEIALVRALEDLCDRHIGMNWSAVARAIGVTRTRARELGRHVALKCREQASDPPVRCDGLRPLVLECLGLGPRCAA